MSDKKTEYIGKQAALLSLIEIGLGSFLHSLNIPLRGHFLSLNQIAFMSRVSKEEQTRDAGLQISAIASLLKSLSPAGKKLSPMLAILAQGLIFSLGPLLFGVNLVGLFLGSILSSLWAFIHPVLMIYLLFGQSSVDVAEHFYKEFSKIIPMTLETVLIIVAALMVVKMVLAVAVSFIAVKVSDQKFADYQSKMMKQEKPKQKTSTSNSTHPFFLALKDLFNPLFIISFFMTALFFFVTKVEYTQMIWGLMRPLAIGFILFFIIRVYPVENLAIHLEKIGLKKLSSNLRKAILYIREYNLTGK